MNVAFNYIKFATYSAVPFVVILALNVAVIWRTVRVSPHLRRTAGGGGGEALIADRGQGSTSCGTRSGYISTGGETWELSASPPVSTSLPANSGNNFTASQASSIILFI